MKNVLTINMVHIHVFPKEITKICYDFGKNSRNNYLSSKYMLFSAYFGQIFALPRPGIGFMNRDLA